MVRDLRDGTDIFLDKIPGETDRTRGVNVDDLAQLVDIPLHRANRLHDPDFGRYFSREVTDQRQRRQSRGLGAGADDVAHESRVVELVLQAREVEGGAEEAELRLICCGSDYLDRNKLRDELCDGFDRPGDVACFTFEQFEAAGCYR